MRFLKPAFASLLLLSNLFAVSGSMAESRLATIDIDATKVENSINPALYGQFVEVMFGGVDGSLWTELIRNRSFEEPPNEIGLSRFWEREPDDRNHDPALQFFWDESISYPPHASLAQQRVDHSLRTTIQQDQWDVRQRRGVSQGRMPVEQGVKYRGYVWLKGGDFDGFVTVALEQDRTGGQSYASVDLPVKSDGWAKYEFTLSPTHSDPLAKFSILFHGTGRIWLDQVSLMPGDSVNGVRADVFEKVKELHPSFIRWPGGNVAQDYHWMWGIGPRDERSTWTNRAWWNEVESSDFGTDEFLQLCRNLGTQPSITVNVEGRGATAEEAAAWVEYANGPATSKYGRMRATNGHPEPYGVKYWEIGNEIWGAWEIGHSDAETYARNFNRYAAAMKAVDPKIQLIASGGNDLAWNRTLLQIAGKQIDLVAIHHYYGAEEMHGDPANLLAHPLTLNAFYEQMRQILRQLVPGRHILLTVNEWNTSLPLPSQHTMRSALYAGRIMNMFERNGDVIASSAVSDMVNGWSGGVIQASRNGLFVTPTYLVNKLYNDHLGAERLAARVAGPVFDTTLEGKRVPSLDAVVNRSADGSKIFINAVNADLMSDLHVRVHLTGAVLDPVADVDTVSAKSPDVANTFSTQNAVSTQAAKLKAGNDFELDLRSDSVSTITLHVRKAGQSAP